MLKRNASWEKYRKESMDKDENNQPIITASQAPSFSSLSSIETFQESKMNFSKTRPKIQNGELPNNSPPLINVDDKDDSDVVYKFGVPEVKVEEGKYEVTIPIGDQVGALTINPKKSSINPRNMNPRIQAKSFKIFPVSV